MDICEELKENITLYNSNQDEDLRIHCMDLKTKYNNKISEISNKLKVIEEKSSVYYLSLRKQLGLV